jgi:heptosyltransferase-2
MGLARNVIFIQTAFIGDAILATSMLESWHLAHPQDHLHLVVRSGNKSLFQDHPFLAGLHVWEKTKNPFSRYFNLLKLGLRIRRAGVDVLVTPHRHVSSGMIRVMSGAKSSACFSEHPMAWLFGHRELHGLGNGEHEIERNHRLIVPWVGSDKPRMPKLYAHQRAANEAAVHSFGVAAPSSQWATKKWPSEHWVQWLDLEYERFPQRQIVLMGGPDDRSDLEDIRQRSSHNQLEIRTDLTLLESAGLMEKASWVVTNDSGPMHMASALNVPTVAIFCSTLPAFGFGPLADKSTIVEKAEELSCRPCGVHGKTSCPVGHFKCGMDVSPQQVLTAVSAVSSTV